MRVTTRWLGAAGAAVLLAAAGCDTDNGSGGYPSGDTLVVADAGVGIGGSDTAVAADTATSSDAQAGADVGTANDGTVQGDSITAESDATSTPDTTGDVGRSAPDTTSGGPDTTSGGPDMTSGGPDTTSGGPDADTSGQADVATPDTSGGTLPDDACTMEQACNVPGALCFAPDDLFCGICMSPDVLGGACNSVADCPAGKVCDAPPPGTCLCEPGIKVCKDPCSSPDECGPGMTCNTGVCLPMPCGSDSDCASSFACMAGLCVRKPCVSSTECTGWCVKGHCYDEPGFCSPPPP